MALHNSPKKCENGVTPPSSETIETLKQALHTSQIIVQALMDLSPYPISITRVEDGRFMYANRRQCKITGYPPEQMFGRTAQDLGLYVNQSDRERMVAMVKEQGQLDKFETKFKTRDGRFIHAEMSARPVEFDGEACLIVLTTYVNTISKAHQALRESENRYQNILNSITECYYEVDLAGRFTFFNDAVVKLFGYSTDELMGMSYKAYTTPEDAEKVNKVFNNLYRGDIQTALIDYSIIRKDGTSVQMEVSASLLRDNKGNLIGFHGINRDRTPQKKAEEALRQSEDKYRRILESMEEGYWEIDLKGNFTSFNDAVLKIHGYSADELMGMSYKQYLRPEQAKENFKLFSSVYQTGQPIQIQAYEIIRKDGSICFSELSGYPLRDHNGKTIGFWGIVQDRTEKILAERALQKSEEQYRLLVENANDGIYITQEGRIKFHNQKMAKITGYSGEELKHMTFAELVHPEDKEAIYEVRQQKLAEGQIPDVFVFRMVNKAQQLLWVELSAIRITWEGQAANLNFLRDVTHQKKTEDRLRQAQKMEAIGTLAGGIAHDFNNILSAILGYAELAADDAKHGSLQQDNLNEVVIAGHRAKDLVHQILAFARQSDEKLKPVMVSIIAKEALKLLRSSIPTTIEIKQNIASNASVLGNPTQLHQIMMNLCTNAAQAMEQSGGILSVDLAAIQVHHAMAELNLAEGDYLKLSVSDTGCGIAPEVMPTIFDPYFTTKAPGEGTGMGLSVVQGIVEKYGGRIAVESEPDKGATFTVYLPIIQTNIVLTAVPSKALPSANERILLVDDETAIVKMGSRMLETLSYQVTQQTSSLEALRIFGAKPDDFDLVITDMTMPDMTGEQLAREIMRIRPDIPVVLCTGYSKQINEELALQMGIKAFIYKPIKKSDLAITVRKVLDEKTECNRQENKSAHPS